MSTLTETIAKLRAALGVLPESAVQQAHEQLADDLVPQLATLTAGTSQDSRLAAAYTRIAELSAELEQVRSLLQVVRRYTEGWISEHGGAPPASAPPSLSAASSSGTGRTVAERVAARRARLEHPWPYGKPLRGWRLAGRRYG